MTTDYRALCAELIDELEEWIACGDEADCADAHAVVDRARAALAQPEPVEPTDEELHQLWLDLYAFHDGPTSGDVAEIACAALARHGRPAITPIPVSERLPGTEDVESKVRYCWWYNYEDQAWHYCDAAHCNLNVWTHWLPHWALPLPAMASCG